MDFFSRGYSLNMHYDYDNDVYEYVMKDI